MSSADDQDAQYSGAQEDNPDDIADSYTDSVETSTDSQNFDDSAD